MARVLCLLGTLVLAGTTLYAQAPVEPVADVVSYATAAVNPAIAAYKAARSAHPWCALGQISVSEVIGNVSVLTLKHFLVSPRPCLGCDTQGMPSGHAMNSVIGVSRQWSYGVYFAVGTAQLRTEAHRHTKTQVAVGLLVGGLAEGAGHALVRCAP